MTKLLRYLLPVLLAAALTACGDDSEFYYTTSYPVVRIDASVTIEEQTPPVSGGGTEGGETTENPLIQQIADDVTGKAPVQAGGSYDLAFKYFSSGRLTVRTSADGEVLSGGFEKEPGSDVLHFYFGDTDYACTASTYTTDEGTAATLLTADLTRTYQTLYPDANITKVLRQEYTSHQD